MQLVSDTLTDNQSKYSNTYTFVMGDFNLKQEENEEYLDKVVVSTNGTKKDLCYKIL